jgi:hypothetical protein
MKPKPAALLDEKMEKIRASLTEYDSGDAENAGLARIARRKDALRALAEMQLTDRQFEKVVFSLVQAIRVRRDFRELLAGEAVALRRTEKLRAAVTDLRNFVTEVLAPPRYPLSASISISAEDKRTCAQGLYTIEWLIKTREQIARETPRRIGATRKKSIKTAQENAGIGWLAASIKGITGRSYIRQTCILAETVFDIREIGEDRLRGASRNFVNREWRMP